MAQKQTEQPEKLDGASMNISAENRARLKDLFPTVFSETKNEKGELVESIDFEKLKAELGTFSDVFESRRERYGMEWPGKKEALRLIQTPSYATLKPCREESISFDTTQNLFIEGDNLEVLKLLQKSYYGKVKMIYIDPPYNTGKEFIYPDNFSESLETYLEYAGLIDGEGKKFSTNTANEGRFHTKWLNMMYPRLYLARNLLKDDGVIFISIDDNEVSNLRKMCDEIFGEENFVANVVWQKRTSPEARVKMSTGHENILLYIKHREGFDDTFSLLSLSDKDKDNYKNPDNDPRGPWVSSDFTAQGFRPNQVYKIITPGGVEYTPPEGRCWKNMQSVFLKQLQEGRMWFGNDGKGVPRRKTYLSEREGKNVWTWWTNSEAGHTQEATQELKKLFECESPMFDYPKPIKLLKRMLEISTGTDNDIILDFFCGSATTAHAVLDLNKQDGGNRKFILVQLPEPCAKDSEAFKAGYKTIADIGKERIRRVIKKINNEQDGKLEIEETSNQDLGFKVLKLNKSNFKQWQALDPSTAPEEVANQLSLYIDHIDHKAQPEDLLYEILIKSGYMPTEAVETKTIAGKKVYSVSGGSLLLCLENDLSKELINAVAELEPMQFICLDSAFHGNDQLKTNAVQTFAARNMQRDKHNQIVFKTV